MEIPSEACSPACRAEANVSVADARLRAESDEEKGKCMLAVTLTLRADGCLYEEVAVDAVTDAFSRENRVTLAFSDLVCEGAGETMRLTERVSGRAALSAVAGTGGPPGPNRAGS